MSDETKAVACARCSKTGLDCACCQFCGTHLDKHNSNTHFCMESLRHVLHDLRTGQEQLKQGQQQLEQGQQQLEHRVGNIAAATATSPTQMRDNFEQFVDGLTLKSNVPLWFSSQASEADRTAVVEHIFANPPPVGASESKFTQPWCTDAFDLITKLRSEKDKRKVVVAAKRLKPTMFIIDTHEQPTIGSRKPDFVAYAGQERDISSVVLFGDVKPAADDFNSEERGHVVGIATRLLELQQFRPGSRTKQGAHVTFFLINARVAQLFQLQRFHDGASIRLSLQQTRCMTLLGDGGHALLALLCAPLHSLGYGLPDVEYNGQRVKLARLLGVGATALVFEGTHPQLGDRLVVKYFFNQYRHRLATERANLTSNISILLSADGRVPILQGVSADQTALILQPVGRQFALTADEQTTERKLLPSAAHFAYLVDTLQLMHRGVVVDGAEQKEEDRGLIHRDITLSNCFGLDDGKALVNDEGLATRNENRRVPYIGGTLKNASLDILRALPADPFTMPPVEYIPLARHDLEALVCCVFQRVSPAIYAKLDAFGNHTKRILAFWEEHLKPDVWRNMIEAARAVDYAQLKKLIAALLP